MKKFLYSLFLTTLISGIIVSCNSSKGTKANVASDSTTHADLEYIEDFFDFGSIAEGEIVSHTFRFKNAGNAPLIIKDAITSCGCTTPKLSSKVLNPGEDGSIEVVFNSTGWYGSQYKSVTLRTNSPIREKSVTIKANVVSNH